jgi:hypothetical protein
MTMLYTIAIFVIHEVGNSSRENTSGIDIGACNSMHDNHQIFLQRDDDHQVCSQQIKNNNSTEKIHCNVMESESPVDRSKSKSFIHEQISTPLIVFKGTRVLVLAIVVPRAYCHLLEEGGFDIIARDLPKFSEVLKWDELQ